MNVKTLYVCPICDEEHERYLTAKYCCDPIIREVSVCGECGERYEDELPAVAENCCKAKVAEAERQAILRRCFCGEVVTDEDAHDAQILGSIPRCRSCILAVAPELQTADAIAAA